MSVDTSLAAALADRYTLLRELGQGGMATVYLARDLKHDREVALKVLKPELAAVLGRERFLAEIRLTARLEHPHILTLLDSGESAGHVWFALPYIRGESLRAKLTRERQLPIAEAVTIARQVAAALDYAHRHGVIHRDVKPENILLHEGEAMLADFGIALAVREAGGERLTATGLSIGTPQYMSPEQATAERHLDARSDVYCLGAVLYEMLSGEPPFSGITAQAIVAKLMVERPTSLRTLRDTVPPALEAVVFRALAKVPADRYATAAAFAEALAAPAEATPVVAIPVRRAAIAGLGLTLLALAGLLTWRQLSSPDPARRGEASLTQVTFAGNASVPAISPDGRQVAYASRQCLADADCTHSVVIEDLASSERRTIGEGYRVVWSILWSPDQRALLVNAIRGRQTDRDYLLSTLGGREQDLGCCFTRFLGTADTLVQAPSWPTLGTDYWLRTRTSAGRTVDSLRVVAPDRGYVVVNPSPDGRLLLLSVVAADLAESVRVLDREGRLLDSLSLHDVPSPWDDRSRIIVDDPVAAARVFWLQSAWEADSRGVVVMMRDVGARADRWSLVRLRVSNDGRISRAADTLARDLALPGFPWPQRQNLTAGGGAIALFLGDPHRSLVTLERRSTAEVPRRGEVMTEATGELEAAVSPDGDEVLVARRVSLAGAPATQLEVWPFGAREGRPLGAPQPRLRRAGWSRDGQEILRLISGEIPGHFAASAMDVATGRVRELEPVADSLLPQRTMTLSYGLMLQRVSQSPTGSGPFRYRARALTGAGEFDLSFGGAAEADHEPFVIPVGDSGWVLAALGLIPGPITPGPFELIGYSVRAGVESEPRGRWRMAGGELWTTVHADTSGLFELADVPWASGSFSSWTRLTPRGAQHLGRLPVRAAPTPFSLDGRRAVAVELTERSDVWILRPPE